MPTTETGAELLETLHAGVATLTLNRPERLNALSSGIVAGLLEALPRLGADPAVRAIVLTGAGRAFCAGGDLKAMAASGDRGHEKRIADLRHSHAVPLAIARLPKLVVARINGVAVGAGLALALACDFRVATRSAKLKTGFAGVALSGDWGGAWMLTRLVGAARARELYLLDESLEAEAARACGMVTRVFDDASFDADAAAFAATLARGPTLAYGYMKQNLLAAETSSYADLLDLEASHTARTGLSEDHREAARAFAEKRKPAFTGR